ncbi:MAG: hypothetical protein ACT4QF_14340 [Sporichthyaceae bacterium]
MDRFRLRSAVVLGALGAAVAMPVGPAVAAGEHGSAPGSGNACTVAGAVASATGVRYEPRTGSYRLKGTMDCTSERYRHAELTGTGEGILGCFGGASQAVLTFVWNTGETSVVKLQTGDFTYGTGGYGQVTKGVLKGSHVGLMWGRAAAGAEARCAQDAVNSYQFAGGIGFHHHD